MVRKDLYQESSQLSSTHGCGDVKRSVTILQKFTRLVDQYHRCPTLSFWNEFTKSLKYCRIIIVGILLTTLALAWQCYHESTSAHGLIKRGLRRWGSKTVQEKNLTREKNLPEKKNAREKKDHESSWAVVSSRESGECEEAQKVKVTLRAKHKWGWGEHWASWWWDI